jgi:hypothetical protein
MKRILWLFVAAVSSAVLFLASCSQPGLSGPNNPGSGATLNNLPTGAGNTYGLGSGIAVDSSGNVYVAGVAASSLGSPNVAVYWKNGTQVALPLDATWVNGAATAVIVDSGGHVIIGGNEQKTATPNVPVYWKDFVITDLGSTGAGSAPAFELAENGSGAILLAGATLGTNEAPVFWQTSGAFTSLNMNGQTYGSAFGLSVISSNVYVVGTLGATVSSQVPVYWLNNGTPVFLNIGSNTTGVAFNVRGDSSGNVYIVGQVTNGSTTLPCYWKNGTLTTLTLGTYAGGNATGVVVDSSGNVWISGFLGTLSNPEAAAVYWKNGTLVTLPLGSNTVGAGVGIALDSSGNVYIAGGVATSSSAAGTPAYWKIVP